MSEALTAEVVIRPFAFCRGTLGNAVRFPVWSSTLEERPWQYRPGVPGEKQYRRSVRGVGG